MNRRRAEAFTHCHVVRTARFARHWWAFERTSMKISLVVDLEYLTGMIIDVLLII